MESEFLSDGFKYLKLIGEVGLPKVTWVIGSRGQGGGRGIDAPLPPKKIYNKSVQKVEKRPKHLKFLWSEDSF